MHHLTAPELATWLNDPARGKPVLLDVREPWEVALGQLAGAVPIPMRSVPERVSELDETRAIVCICHHGAHSLQVAHFLEQNGFTNISNLTGGVHAWSLQVDPTLPLY